MIYEKPLAEYIDFAAEEIMTGGGNAGIGSVDKTSPGYTEIDPDGGLFGG